MNSLYFDYAAATPVDKAVLSAMTPYFTEQFYNPSALYLQAQSVKKSLDNARSNVAKVLGAKSSEVIFTAGGTESDNLAIKGVMQAHPGTNCIVSAIEHDAVLEPAKNHSHKIIPVDESGFIKIDELVKLIDEKTSLVSVMYVSNEIGTIQPLSRVVQILKQVRADRKKSGNQTPIYLHTDACQAANYLQLLVNTLGIDLMTLNGGKIYGPKQSGILYIKTGVKLSPQVLGGGQERRVRSGTENVANCVGFAVALENAQKTREKEADRLTGLKSGLIESLESKVPGVIINGSKESRLANNVHITIPGTDNERLMMSLDEVGIMVATGSACSASNDVPSHVLTAIGLSDEQARSSLRITLGRYTDDFAINTLAKAISTLVAT